MRRYTTPFQELYVDVDLTDCDVYVTYADLQGNTMLTLTNATVETMETGSKVVVRLTQEQSVLFQTNQEYQVQVNWMNGNDRFATCIARFRVTDNLLKEILP